MIKQKSKYWVSVLLFLSFCINAITGLLILFLPYAQHIKFMGLLKYQWKILHLWSGLLLIIFVIIHIVDHWNWMIRETKKRLKK